MEDMHARARVLRIVLVVTGLFILAGAAVWWGRPIYRHYKEQRFLRMADEFLKAGDTRKGLLSLRQAQAANPRNVETARRLAELLTSLNSPLALGWWRRVVELNPTPENRFHLVAAALILERPPYPIASQTLQEMARAGETNLARFHTLASQLALQTRRIPEAVFHLERATQLDPTNLVMRLNLAALQVQHSDPEIARPAREALVQLSETGNDPHLRLLALRSLVAISLVRNEADAAERFSRELLQLPGATFSDKVQHLSVLVAAGRPETNAWLQQLQQETGTNTAHITQLAGWLIDRQRARDALVWLETIPISLRTNPPLTLAVSDALLALQDWQGLTAWLTPQNWEDQEPMRLTLLMRAAREQGRRDLAQGYWRRVLDWPGGRGEILAAVAQLLEKWGWHPEMDEVLWALVRRAPWHEWAWEILIKKRYEAGDTAGLFQIYSARIDARPNSLEVKNNLAALGLLLQRDLDRCRRLAREVYLADTNNPVGVSTYAFALYQQGDMSTAVHLLDQLPAEAKNRPEIAPYVAIILAHAGRVEEARKYAASAQPDKLLPEERRLLQQALNAPTGSSG
ncbi:MAG: hypothetical protein RMN51_12435 [Verrucomicrobiota bacterium]|nr:hypothetical protein [Limisphaera sp.]MDW8382900.1 hypothetical protein [Verrucomicrobiota bacterium]